MDWMPADAHWASGIPWDQLFPKMPAPAEEMAPARISPQQHLLRKALFQKLQSPHLLQMFALMHRAHQSG